jgi:hypothetical protein
MRKELFDDMIGEVPPSTVDVDAAIARGRRAARLGRLGSPVVVAGVAVALVGGVAFALQPDQGVRAADGARQPDQSVRAEPSRGPCGEELPTGPAPTEAPAAAVTRMSSALKAAVSSRLADDATVVAVNEAGPLDFAHLKEAGGPTDHGSCMVSEDSFVAGANVVRGAMTGSIAVYVARAVGPLPTCDDNMSEQTDCEAVTGPRGERGTATKLALEGGVFMCQVDLDRLDGTSVSLTVTDAAHKGDVPGSGQLPLSRDQLVEIALDPGLTLFP